MNRFHFDVDIVLSPLFSTFMAMVCIPHDCVILFYFFQNDFLITEFNVVKFQQKFHYI